MGSRFSPNRIVSRGYRLAKCLCQYRRANRLCAPFLQYFADDSRHYLDGPLTGNFAAGHSTHAVGNHAEAVRKPV
jgi:hypothetical protein